MSSSVVLTFGYTLVSVLLVAQLCSVTPWTQSPLSMEFSRQEYWSGCSFPSLGHLPNLGFEPGSPALEEDSLPSEILGRETPVSPGA